MELRIPKLRTGTYFPIFLEPRRMNRTTSTKSGCGGKTAIASALPFSLRCFATRHEPPALGTSLPRAACGWLRRTLCA
uniref:hypothetical protein n=1 Tax=Sinorhizobium chiapasense TaxID=501572 RepID=UPI002FE21C82